MAVSRSQIASACAVLAAFAASAALAGYDRPPQPLLAVMHAPSPPTPLVDPTGERILLVSGVDYPEMARVAEPYLRLAGVRIEPRNRSQHDTPGGYGIRSCMRDYTLVEIAGRNEVRVPLPEGACPGVPTWSADGARFLFQNAAAETVELWVGDASTGAVRRIDGVQLNPMFGDAARWMPDQKTVLVKLVPAGQGAPPAAPLVPPGPGILDSTGGEGGESSTYEARDTLTGPHDEALFDYYGLSQLALVDVASGAVKPIGTPALHASLEPAPDGVHLLVESIVRPYSYVTTWSRFPREVAVWDLTSGATHRVASLPLADRVPVHGVPVGPRDFEWRSNEPATLVWAEALDGGDWKTTVPARDKVLLQRAPFDAPPVEIARSEQRFQGFAWGSARDVALRYEYDHNRHWERVFVVDVDRPEKAPRLLWDMSSEERYEDPGSPVMRQLPNGAWVMRQEGDAIYLRGQGASPTGDRPFLDRLNLRTKASERLFRSASTAYERFLASVGPTRFLTWHESPTDPPNAFLRTIGTKAKRPAAGEATFASTSTAVTRLPDPTPAVRAIRKRLVKYQREDGTELSFTLYTPPDYREGTRVPAILYAYPLDYAGAKQAGQVSGSEQTFTRLRNYRLLLLAGYAIIDNAAFPIVGDPQQAYDTYLEQLVADARAAVAKAVELGVVDPERIGVTGHSHGALMTVNLLAHSDLFRAGVATSGSYNKTLTPFGFQNERRSVWQAQNVYLQVSPFFFADKIKTPLLILHGEDDANPGTEPVQSRKLYQAVRGNGGTTRLVMLPHEPHWYTAMESNEQLVAEMLAWFDKYVKNASPRASAAAAGGSGQ